MINERILFERLDQIIALLNKAGKPPPLFMQIINGIATGVGILGILAIVETIKKWVGG